MSQTATKERPILFSSKMVNAILSGAKSQTRRILKPQPPGEPIACERYFAEITDKNGMIDAAKNEIFGVYGDDWGVACPYGGPGDRLWLRETFDIVDDPAAHHVDDGERISTGYECADAIRRGPNGERWVVDYRADSPTRIMDRVGTRRWKPSIFMPRWASRITLEISEVRVERLQEISEADAIAEGAQCAGVPASLTNRGAFAKLWDSINGKSHPWASSPWVWCISFKMVLEGQP